MKMKRISIWAVGSTCIFLSIFAGGYAPRSATAQSQTGLIEAKVESIGVMPFLKGRHGSDIGETLDCPLSQLYCDRERLSGDSHRILTEYVHEALQKRHGEKVISLEKTSEVYGKIAKDEAEDTLRTLAVKLGESLEANLMVAGTVWRYEERVGGSMGAFSPASVAFAIYLFDVASGRMLWEGSFNETQRSLFENVLDTWAFLKKGAKWLSADELARYGVREVFKKSPL
jgi:hypothetical protein